MKYLIVPDIHGRNFWREPVKKALEENIDIIFLGDYLDAYPEEFDPGIDYHKLAFEGFEDILKLKKENPDKITLLLGNHCCSYLIGTNVCDCRRDRLRYQTIQTLFRQNKANFSLIKEIKQEDKRFIISHAGVSFQWLESLNSGTFDRHNFVDFVNNEYTIMMRNEYPENTSFAYSLATCSYFRGGWNPYGSIIWADVREFIKSYDNNIGYQIFGHTRCYEPIVTKDFAMLDCSKCFYLDNGQILDMDNKIVPTIDLK